MTSDGASGAASGIATTLQKLPQLDTEHLKAITASFPGRLLGRTAALLSFVAMLLGWFKLVDWALPQELLSLRSAHPALFNAAYYGIPFLIVLGQLVRETLQAQRKKRMATRVIEGVVADPTYFRLSPYTGSAHDRKCYRRADKADERVAEWVEKTPAPVLFLTGDSGVGKSSLLEAGALPRLAEKGFDVIAVRAFSDPLAAMLDALAADGLPGRRVAGDADALSALQRSTRRLARQNRRLLVVIDQAEELLVVIADEPRARFFDLLQRITAEPLAGLVILLVLRSEYEPALAELGLPPLSHGETWFKVGAFTEPAARAFLEDSSVRLAEGQLSRVLKGAAALEQTQGLYRPIVLNMLGLILARFAGSLPEHLDLERLIQHHLRDCITRSDLADDARLALPAMITEAGTKWPRREAEIAEAAGRPIGNVRHCLQTLALPDAGIVRGLGRQQAVVWEIAHDFLALQLGLLLGRLKRSWWRRVLPYAGPVLALAWLIVLGGGAALWPEVAYLRAKSRMSEAGFIVNGNRVNGHTIQPIPFVDQLTPPREDRWEILIANVPLLAPVVALHIDNTLHNVTLSALPALPRLTELEISSNGLVSLSGLPALPELKKLTITLNKDLASLSGLPELPELKKLTITLNKDLASLSGLPELPRLTELDISENTNLASLSGIPALPAVTSMIIANRSLSGLPELPSLTELRISENTNLASLSSLPALPALRRLEIYLNHGPSLSGLPELPRLTELDIAYNGDLASLSGLPELPALKKLTITYNNDLASLSGLPELTKHGAEWLAEAWRVDPETIRYPRGATVFFHDLFHRIATLDFEIAFRQDLERHDGAVEFYHRYFDSSGANRNPDPAGHLQRPTKVPLGDRFFHPDAVFAVSLPGGARFLYVLEVYNGIDTRRVYGQLQKHMLALQEGRLSDLYRYEKAHRVLCIFENDTALQAAAQRLRADPVFTGQLYRHFAFATLADLQADFLTGWHFWDAARTSIFDVGP